jgi:2-oxoglutarate ferredoxin oxidoreductase subunit beta
MEPMTTNPFDKHNDDIAWCPGCGNFKILEMLKQALADLSLTPQNVVVVSGIGQAPKTPHYFRTNMFNGLHGRALPAATGVKASNPSLTVIAEGGDGDMYGEGGNHFLHAIRRNPDVAHLVHTNMVYGLTKGQASPTSQLGFKTPIQIDGVISEPVNPIAVAVAQDASFVARAFAGDVEQTKEIVKRAILHKGYALVDILQPCVTYNKVNTFRWFKEHSYYLDQSHDSSDRAAAFARAIERDRFALGVVYEHQKPSFEEQVCAYHRRSDPLHTREVDLGKLREVMMRWASV